MKNFGTFDDATKTTTTTTNKLRSANVEPGGGQEAGREAVERAQKEDYV